MRRFALPALAAAMLLGAPAAFAYPTDTFSLDIAQSSSGITSLPAGTVTLTQKDNFTVDVNVTLSPGFVWAFANGSDFFAFQLLSAATLTPTTPSVPSGQTLTAVTGSYNFTPYGVFNSAIECTTCGTGTSSNFSDQLDFSVAFATGNSNLFTQFGTSTAYNNGQPGGYYFSADVGQLVTGGQANTGNVATNTPGTCVGCGNGNVPLPEPTSIALIGVGLAGLAVARRTRRAA
jgi:hypothetical protein